jgi:hypothetical protein
MADPTLATPTMPVGMLMKYLDRAAPAGSTFVASVTTAANAIVWTAPAFVRSNYGTYPADPTLQVPAIPVGQHHSLQFTAAPPASAFAGSVTTAANAVTWPAPGYPHGNYGVYP